MARIIQFSMLKACNPSLLNRDFSNQAKTVVVGGVTRTRFSSQSQKAAIREACGNAEIRSAHLEDLVETVLDARIEDGTIQDEKKDALGEMICSLIGADWKKRESKTGKKEEKGDDQNAEGEKVDGRTIVVTNAAELKAICEAVLRADKAFEEGLCESGKKKNKDKARNEFIEKEARKALDEVRISIDKALFGVMATSGIIETVYGATQFGHAFSIDAAKIELDDWNASFVGRNPEEEDPFFGDALTAFTKDQASRPRAEGLGSGDIYSNTMFHYSSIDIKDLLTNLTLRGNVTKDDAVAIMQEKLPDYAEAFVMVEPAAKQRSSSSHVAPAVVYIESVKDGYNLQPDFTKVIGYDTYAGKSVAEQGVEVMERFAEDQTFRSGDINRYVMLGSEYKAYEAKFEAAGVKVLHSMNEMRKVIADECERLA